MALAAFVTIHVGANSHVPGLVVGTLVPVFRSVRTWPVPLTMQLYGSIIRWTLSLVQILDFDYALLPLIGLDIGPMTAGILAMRVPAFRRVKLTCRSRHASA